MRCSAPLVLIFFSCITFAADAESGLTGVWTAYDVGFPPWTLTLKANGIKLSGTVQQRAHDSSGYNTTLTMPVEIYNGQIDGNKITFKWQDTWRHDRTITFSGIVNGDEITFTRAVLVKPGGNPGSNGIFGASGAAEFTAKRVVLSSGTASAPANPDQEPGAKPQPAAAPAPATPDQEHGAKPLPVSQKPDSVAALALWARRAATPGLPGSRWREA
jgi:hypothetical protein